MRVAVSGASGFIGEQVINRLLQEQDIDVVALSRSPVEAWGSEPRLRNILCDVSSPEDVSCSALGSPDMLLHLAWGGLSNFKAPSHVMTEAPAHYRFLDSLLQSGLKHLLVSGTCLEYGIQNGPLCETFAPQPTSSYGYSKSALHQLLLDAQASNEFSLVWARLFYLYGPNQTARTIYSLLRQAVEAKKATFPMSMGEQLRDYLRVDQVADLLVRLALPGKNFGIVNVCSGQPISIRRLVETWLKDNDWEIELELGVYPYPDYEALAFWGDTTKLEACIGAKAPSLFDA